MPQVISVFIRLTGSMSAFANSLLDSNSILLLDSNSSPILDNSICTQTTGSYKLVAYNYAFSDVGNLYNIGLGVVNVSGTFIRSYEPIIRPSYIANWEQNHVKDPFMLIVGDRIYLYYAGSTNSDYNYSIGLTYSDDYGLNWTKYTGSPVISQTQAWETAVGNSSVQFPVVCYEPDEPDSNQRWKMWYSGDGSGRGIGYAYSPDGFSWTKFGANPVLSLGSAGQWDDDSGFSARSVVKVTGTYHLFYSASDGTNFKCGYATFNNPTGTYTKSADNPILSPDNVTTFITSNVTVNDVNISVSGSSSFSIGCPVWVYNGSTYYLTKVVSKPNSTTIEVFDPAPVAIASGGGVRSVAYSSVGSPFVMREDGIWKIYFVAFIPGLLPVGGLKEISMYASGAALNSLAIDYNRSILLAISIPNSRLTNVSCENPCVLNFYKVETTC